MITSTHTRKLSRIVLALSGLACSTASAAPTQPPAPAAPAAQTAAQTAEQDARMAWWRDAKFGMFIHWGLYAVPAGDWPGKG
ncbi:MAG: alpha-L-fucosidase, partial [Planctomycetota bacterium]